jgi:hypothetical protein
VKGECSVSLRGDRNWIDLNDLWQTLKLWRLVDANRFGAASYWEGGPFTREIWCEPVWLEVGFGVSKEKRRV